MDKIMVKKYTGDLKDELDCEKLADVLAKVNAWIIRYGHDAALYIDTEYYYGEEYVRIRIVEHRLETDEEYEKRIGETGLAKRQQEQKERAEYERLKAKFGE